MIQKQAKKPVDENVVSFEDLLTIDQAANVLGIKRTKFLELVNLEGLPVVRLGHRSVRVRPIDLHQWVATRVQKGA